jgi:acyl-CoA dehydrogenase
VVEHAPSHDEMTLRAALARSAATVGALEAAYEITREHVTTRRQFDRPLVRLQVVGAHLARMAIELALARAAFEAAVAAQADGDDVAWATAAAKLTTAHAATTVSRLAHQLHGAIGMTREHSLQLWTRRLWSWRDEGGSEARWAARLGAGVLADGPDALWAFVAR